MGQPLPENPRDPAAAIRRAACATVFASSGAIMLMQLVAGRVLARFLGQSLYTWTSIIGVTLAGIAIGNYLGGRLADRTARRSALAALFLLAAGAELSVLLLNNLAGGWTLLVELAWPTRIFLHVFLVFLVPFACLGTISPVVARRALAAGGATGRTMGGLYAWSLAGSLLGSFLTGYWLLAHFGNQALVFTSAAGLALIGAAWLAAAAWTRGAEPAETLAAHDADRSHPGPRPYSAALAAFLAGLTVMMVELIAARMLAQSYGNSLYTWTTIIGVVLAAMSLGGYAGGWLADRVAPRPLLTYLFMLSAVSSLGAPLINALLRNHPLLWGLPWPVQILSHCVLVFFPAAFLLGAVPPAAVRMALDRTPESHRGRTVGILYSWNAVGSILGTFAAGYVLIASMGAVRTLCVVAVVLSAAALIASPRSKTALGWAVACAVLAGSAFAPWPVLQTLALNLALRPWYGPEVVYADESQYGYIAVQAMDPDQPQIRVMALDKMVHNRTDITNPLDLKYPYEWFYQAVLNRFRPGDAPLDALAIGGGGYTFCHYLELARPGSYIEVAEIDPAVTEAAHAAFGLPRDTQLRIYHLDGRNHVEDLARQYALGVKRPPFDCVFGDSFNDYSVPFHLTTLEFTQRIAGLLSEDGIYLLNMIDMFNSGQFLGAMLNTCRAVFPEVQAFSGRGYLDQRDTFIVVCSKRPLDLTGIAEEINARHQSTGILLTAEQLGQLRDRSRGLVLTDDFAPVDNLLAPVVRLTEESPLIRRLLRTDTFLAQGRLDDAIREAQRIIARSQTMPEAYELLSTALRRAGRPAEAVVAARKAVSLAPHRVEAEMCLAHALHDTGDIEGAATHWKKATERRPDDAGLHASLGGALLRLNRSGEAVPYLRRAVALDPASEAAHINLAGALFLRGDLADAEESLQSALRIRPRNAAVRQQLATVYWKLGKFDQAWEEVHRCQELGGTVDPGFLGALRRDSGREQ
jgi:Flp pilus assembly protein TadD/spermidine synthase/MFS family permease